MQGAVFTDDAPAFFARRTEKYERPNRLYRSLPRISSGPYVSGSLICKELSKRRLTCAGPGWDWTRCLSSGLVSTSARPLRIPSVNQNCPRATTGDSACTVEKQRGRGSGGRYTETATSLPARLPGRDIDLEARRFQSSVVRGGRHTTKQGYILFCETRLDPR
jgi:hypothetical protein